MINTKHVIYYGNFYNKLQKKLFKNSFIWKSEND
jgi:hypothetical protein